MRKKREAAGQCQKQQQQQSPNEQQQQKKGSDTVTSSQQAEKFREIKKKNEDEAKENHKGKISFAGCNKIWSSIYKATQFCCLVLLSVNGIASVRV